MSDQATQVTEIEAPPSAVFAAAAAVERYPEWAPEIKSATVLERDDDGSCGLVAFRAAAMGRSTSYTLRYYYGSNPHRIAWRLVEGDLMRALNGEYLFEPLDGDPPRTRVTYNLHVDLVVPLPGFVKRRAEARIMRAALEQLRLAETNTAV